MKNLLMTVACVIVVACGGSTEEVGTMHNDDRGMMEDRPRRSDMPEPVMAEVEPEDVEEVPMIRPVGEDPSEDEKSEPTRQELDDVAVDDEMVAMEEEPEALTPVAPEPVATLEPEDATEPESVPVAEPEPTEEPDLVETPEPTQAPEDELKLIIWLYDLAVREIHAGADDQSLFQFSLTATAEDLEVEMLPIQISCDSGRLYGSAGTPYFRDIKVTDVETGALVAGPRELAPPADGMIVASSWFVLEDPFLIPAGTTRHLVISADMAAFEDVSGEFFGNDCRVTLTSLEGIVSVGSPSEALPNEAINMVDDILGHPFTVSAAAWGEFSFCDAGGISEGCCTTGGFAKDYVTPLSSMLIKGSGSTVYYLASDGQRYVFPNRDALVSWFETDADLLNGSSDICGGVREFRDSTIAGLPIGGNMTIRPGTYLVTISTDPAVYAVERNRTLRRIGYWYPTVCSDVPASGAFPCASVGNGPDSEDLAHQIFPDAEQRLRVVPDGFFVNYTMGTPVESAEEYDPAVEYAWGSPNTLDAELGLYEP